MRIRLIAADRRRSYDTQLGRFTDAEAIPCHRCGVCCRRWQPLLSRPEAERLAQHLGLTLEVFLAEYTRPYPLEEDAHLLDQRDGGCVFLRVEDGQAACAVHEVRPQACRDWDASLRRDECLDGLRLEATAGGLLLPLRLYDDAGDSAAFVRHLREATTTAGC